LGLGVVSVLPATEPLAEKSRKKEKKRKEKEILFQTQYGFIQGVTVEDPLSIGSKKQKDGEAGRVKNRGVVGRTRKNQRNRQYLDQVLPDRAADRKSN